MNRYYPTNANQITYLGEVNHRVRDQDTTYPPDSPAIEIRMTPMTDSSIKHSMRTRVHQIGLTLIELLVAMAVFAVLVAIAAPNFTNIASGNRLADETNSLIGAMNFARSEAITRNTQVRVQAAAAGGPPLWENGWTVDWLEDPATPKWTTIKQSGPFPAGIFSKNSSVTFTFLGTGALLTFGESLILCSPTPPGNKNGTSIAVGPGGRIFSNNNIQC